MHADRTDLDRSKLLIFFCLIVSFPKGTLYFLLLSLIISCSYILEYEYPLVVDNLLVSTTTSSSPEILRLILLIPFRDVAGILPLMNALSDLVRILVIEGFSLGTLDGAEGFTFSKPNSGVVETIAVATGIFFMLLSMLLFKLQQMKYFFLELKGLVIHPSLITLAKTCF